MCAHPVQVYFALPRNAGCVCGSLGLWATKQLDTVGGARMYHHAWFECIENNYARAGFFHSVGGEPVLNRTIGGRNAACVDPWGGNCFRVNRPNHRTIPDRLAAPHRYNSSFFILGKADPEGGRALDNSWKSRALCDEWVDALYLKGRRRRISDVEQLLEHVDTKPVPPVRQGSAVISSWKIETASCFCNPRGDDAALYNVLNGVVKGVPNVRVICCR